MYTKPNQTKPNRNKKRGAWPAPYPRGGRVSASILTSPFFHLFQPSQQTKRGPPGSREYMEGGVVMTPGRGGDVYWDNPFVSEEDTKRVKMCIGHLIRGALCISC